MRDLNESKRRGAFLACALALVLVACSSSDDDEGSNPDDGGSQTAQALEVDPNAPLSSMVAVAFLEPTGLAGVQGGTPTNITDYVRTMIEELNVNPNWAVENGVEFPLSNTTTDTVRVISGLRPNVVARWLDPLRADRQDQPDLRFGSNCDYIAYFGEGWDNDWNGDVIGSPPQFNGSPTEAWIWSNHEYISNGEPEIGTAPTGQHLTLAKFLQGAGLLAFDVTVGANWDQAAIDTYTVWFKRQLGGSWMKVVQDSVTRVWTVDLSANNVRYDSTSDTLLRVFGLNLSRAQIGDDGTALGPNIAPGIAGDCSGGQSPWGTVFTAEENVQGYYGDVQDAWSGRTFTGGNYAAGGEVTLTIEPSTGGDFGMGSDPNSRHDRDAYGYLSEIDPGAAPDKAFVPGTDGTGHLKVGPMGRVRWENCTFVTGTDWRLIDGKPLVIYGANDRRGGRIYKWVSASNYTNGMTRAEVRELLSAGTLFVSHFADLNNANGTTLEDGTDDGTLLTDTDGTAATRGNGRWIRMSITSTDIAPNAGQAGNTANGTVQLRAAGATVGECLQDPNHNGIGSISTDEKLLKALYTACNKIGVMELNRPEDLEFSPFGYGSHGPLLYIAFTKHGRSNALDEFGVLNTDITTFTQIDDAPRPSDGHIFVIKEDGDPAQATTFEYWEVLRQAPGPGMFDSAAVDNMMLSSDGGLYFGTDGNFGASGTADALYYLDLDLDHVGTANPTFGLPFRLIAGPSDSEATGPAFNSDESTIFFNVQHPGEGVASSWPLDR